MFSKTGFIYRPGAVNAIQVDLESFIIIFYLSSGQTVKVCCEDEEETKKELANAYALMQLSMPPK